jgi:hypothetical protein
MEVTGSSLPIALPNSRLTLQFYIPVSIKNLFHFRRKKSEEDIPHH